MEPLRVWFNKSFSSVYNIIRLLVAARQPHQFHVLCSHTNREFVGFEPSPECELEPRGLGNDAYVTFCLEFCAKRNVRVFAPGRSRIEIAERRLEFEANGVRLLVPAMPDVLRLFEDKARFYSSLDPSVANAPRSISVSNADEFTTAVRVLRAEGYQVCIKPSRSTGGLGFRILDDSRTDLRNLFGGEVIRISTALVARILEQEPQFRELLVMEYLAGAEYSVDCLSQRGRLLCAVSRRKPVQLGGTQFLEDRPELSALAARITAAYSLDGVFNVQIRYAGNVPKLLEINARMSGGIYFACLSGVNFPAWALALAAETASPDDIPHPQLGVAVHQQYHEFIVRNPLGSIPHDD